MSASSITAPWSLAGASLELMVDISSIFHTSLDYLIVGKEPEARIVRLKQELRAVITGLEEIEKTL